MNDHAQATATPVTGLRLFAPHPGHHVAGKDVPRPGQVEPETSGTGNHAAPAEDEAGAAGPGHTMLGQPDGRRAAGPAGQLAPSASRGADADEHGRPGGATEDFPRPGVGAQGDPATGYARPDVTTGPGEPPSDLAQPGAAHLPDLTMCQTDLDDCPLGPDPHVFIGPERTGLCCCRQPWEAAGAADKREAWHVVFGWWLAGLWGWVLRAWDWLFRDRVTPLLDDDRWCPRCGFPNDSAAPCQTCGYDDQDPDDNGPGGGEDAPGPVPEAAATATTRYHNRPPWPDAQPPFLPASAVGAYASMLPPRPDMPEKRRTIWLPAPPAVRVPVMRPGAAA